MVRTVRVRSAHSLSRISRLVAPDRDAYYYYNYYYYNYNNYYY